MSSGDDPRPVSDALRHVRRELGAPSPEALDTIRALWPDLVGDVLAAHSAPVVLRDGVLRVTVDDAAWRGRFRYLADQLRAAIGARLDGVEVHEIVVTAGPRAGG